MVTGKLEFLKIDEAHPWLATLANGALFPEDLSAVLFGRTDGSDTVKELPTETRIVGDSFSVCRGMVGDRLRRDASNNLHVQQKICRSRQNYLGT
jgi:hypothetical protein